MHEGNNLSSAILSHAGTILAAVPALGFVLAVCREATFFYFLGVDMGQVFDTSDMIRSSAIYVLPAIPTLFVSLFIFTSTSLKAGSAGENSIVVTTSNGVYYSLLSVFTLSALAFFLLGVAPEMGIWSIGLLAFLLIIREVVRLLKPIGLTFRMYLIGMALIFVIGHFSMSGGALAFKIRSGDLSSFPAFSQIGSNDFSNDQLRLIRRLSEGQLVVDYEKESIYYLPNSERSRLTYNLNTEPFQGVLCYVADWCWANGWLYKQTQT